MMSNADRRSGVISMFAIAFVVAAVPAALYLVDNPPHMPKAPPVFCT